MAGVHTENGFDGILNFRDVAEYVNEVTKEQILKPHRFYRSARPDSASAIDRQQLRTKYAVQTIIDLRSKTEHIEAAQKNSQASQNVNTTGFTHSNVETSEELKIPGINYAEINLNGKGFERHLVWQLRYVDLARLAGCMLLGYRLKGISVLGRNVLLPRGLIGLGKDTLEHSGPEIRDVFNVLGDASSYPVLVHCTQGKDRTGLIVILVLLLCGVDVTAIAADYIQSEADLEPEFEERMKEISSIGLDESFAKCPPEFVQEIKAFIEVQYGGIEQYLKKIKVVDDQIRQVRSQLVL